MTGIWNSGFFRERLDQNSRQATLESVSMEAVAVLIEEFWKAMVEGRQVLLLVAGMQMDVWQMNLSGLGGVSQLDAELAELQSASVVSD